jgi:hypothetical protein
MLCSVLESEAKYDHCPLMRQHAVDERESGCDF